MDGNRFDHLSKVLGSVRSRRSIMALALAIESGGLLALLGGEVTGAKKCKPKCPVCKTCKNGKCKKTTGKCGPDGACQNGKCVCSGCSACETCQNGACVSKNGGRCGDAGTCQGGQCICTGTCPQCQTCAQGACVNDNGADCGDIGICQNGECVCTIGCPFCMRCHNGTCVNDDGAVCGTNHICQDGLCICPANTHECPGAPGFPGACCPEGKQCSADGASCTNCVAGQSICASPATCGDFANGSPRCACVTSLDGEATCGNVYGQLTCSSCSTDAECGVSAVCIAAPCVCGTLNACVPKCIGAAGAGSVARQDGKRRIANASKGRGKNP
jgi:hypothetical protein